MACNDVIWDFLKQADLLLNIGFDAVELIKPWSLDTPVIHIDSTPNTDQIYAAEHEIIGPVAASVEAVIDGLGGALGRWTDKELLAHRENLRRRYLDGRTPGRLNPTDVVEIVRARSAPDAIATSDVGSHKLLVGQGWTTHRSHSFLMTNGLSSMGYSLPAAISAKLADPEREVVCFTGDGGLAMVQGELRLASTLRLGITVVVFCDNSLNRIELQQMARQYQSFGTLIEPTDIEALARSMGCDGVMVSSEKELDQVLCERRNGSTTPLVIGAQIDPQQYRAQF